MIPKKTTALVLRRDHDLCVIQGSHCTYHATSAHHRANRGSGGSTILDDPANLVATCVLCNGDLEDCTGDDRLAYIHRGLRLPKRATNEQTLHLARAVPVMWPDGSWWVLGPTRVRILRSEALEVLAVFGLLQHELTGGG